MIISNPNVTKLAANKAVLGLMVPVALCCAKRLVKNITMKNAMQINIVAVP
jgi:hypothetical protein